MIGRDVRADVRIPHPAVSRSHLILRYEDNAWIALDDNSFNGAYVGAQRIRAMPIHGGETVNVGNPNGPLITFDLGAPPGREAPSTDSKRTMNAATAIRSRWRGATVPDASEEVRIGRAADNDVVVPDVLASNHHATMVITPAGARIQQADRFTGTFVNGAPVKDALLQDRDVVTIGNVDFIYEAGHLEPSVQPATQTEGLEVHDVGLTIPGGKVLLDRVSFTARPGTLTAVIGPSGSGKSTLAKTVVGLSQPTVGSVWFEGHNLHAEYAALRHRVGTVPQDDVVHRGLTIAQTLGYAAELRMPPDTTTLERQQAIAQVLEELDLTDHARTRVDALSGGQRKRVGIAMELLTGPSLLVLDEPTSGLDPALDQHVMTMLRDLATAGRVIIVITHSLMFLDLCDEVLLLAPGGKLAYVGPPAGIEDAFGSSDFADVYAAVTTDPEAAQRRFLAQAGPQAAPSASPSVAPAGQPRVRLWRQASTLARRHAALIVANRGHLAFLVALPFIVGLLPLAVGGDTGLRHPPLGSSEGFQTKQILGLVNLGAVFMGTALSIRELVGERPIFRHEQAAGLSATAYLAAKIAVFAAVGAAQAAVLVAIVTAVKGAPPSASALGSARLELFVGVAATCISAAVLGLLVSTVARTANQVLPLTVAVLMVQIVLAGGMVSMTDRAIDPLSWLSPSRWGLAATASTADLTEIVPLIPQDALWRHSASVWLADVGMLAVLALLYGAVARWRLRLRARDG